MEAISIGNAMGSQGGILDRKDAIGYLEATYASIGRYGMMFGACSLHQAS